MAQFTTGSTEMSWEGTSEGVSRAGMEGYLEFLKLNVVEKVIEKLEATEEMNQVINKYWQGQSRDKFLQSFAKTINEVEEDIRSEFSDLADKLSDLYNSYIDQDRQMID